MDEGQDRGSSVWEELIGSASPSGGALSFGAVVVSDMSAKNWSAALVKGNAVRPVYRKLYIQSVGYDETSLSYVISSSDHAKINKVLAEGKQFDLNFANRLSLCGHWSMAALKHADGLDKGMFIWSSLFLSVPCGITAGVGVASLLPSMLGFVGFVVGVLTAAVVIFGIDVTIRMFRIGDCLAVEPDFSYDVRTALARAIVAVGAIRSSKVWSDKKAGANIVRFDLDAAPGEVKSDAEKVNYLYHKEGDSWCRDGNKDKNWRKAQDAMEAKVDALCKVAAQMAQIDAEWDEMGLDSDEIAAKVIYSPLARVMDDVIEGNSLYLDVVREVNGKPAFKAVTSERR